MSASEILNYIGNFKLPQGTDGGGDWREVGHHGGDEPQQEADE